VLIALLKLSKCISIKKNIYEVLIKLHYKSTNCILLIFSVSVGPLKYFARDNGKQGKEC